MLVQREAARGRLEEICRDSVQKGLDKGLEMNEQRVQREERDCGEVRRTQKVGARTRDTESLARCLDLLDHLIPAGEGDAASAEQRDPAARFLRELERSLPVRGIAWMERSEREELSLRYLWQPEGKDGRTAGEREDPSADLAALLPALQKALREDRHSGWLTALRRGGRIWD